MPKVFPFHGLFYNKAKIRDLSKVVTQPYDKIDHHLQQEYYNRHSLNLVQIIKGKDYPQDDQTNNRYTRANQIYTRWLKDQILLQDQEPAFYAYHQIYKMGTQAYTRKGLTALVRLEDYNKGIIHPHEQTHDQPKQDRFNLLTHTDTHFEHIFLLYSDPRQTVTQVTDRFTVQPPFLESVDDFGEVHRIWKITDPDAVRQIQRALERKEAIIADGHHRYETALRYRDYMLKRGKRAISNESFENVLATLVNTDEKGLTILPTHRLIYGAPYLSKDSIFTRLCDYFHIRSYPANNEAERRSSTIELLEDLRIEGYGSHCLGMVFPDSYHLLFLKDLKAAYTVITEPYSEVWKGLDVNILHKLILEPIFGITSERLTAQKDIEYLREAQEVIQKVTFNPERYRAGFLLNPVRIEQIISLIKYGERFPQKTTDFYPKLISGLIMSKIEFA
jgi:uncharacterized protein (DUF1015 family)